jgi:hypothetical protein
MPVTLIPLTQVSFTEKLDISKNGTPFLHVTKDSRDTLVSAETFLVALSDDLNDETRLCVQKVINHISNMLYGFDDE